MVVSGILCRRRRSAGKLRNLFEADFRVGEDEEAAEVVLAALLTEVAAVVRLP